MALSIVTEEAPNVAQVKVVGEVDVSNAPKLREALKAVLARGAQAIEVDLSEVPYIDSTGIGVLVGAAHAAHSSDVSFVVIHPQRNVARVFRLLDVAKPLGVTSV